MVGAQAIVGDIVAREAAADETLGVVFGFADVVGPLLGGVFVGITGAGS